MNRIHKAQQQLAQAEKTLADAVTDLNQAKAASKAAEATGTLRQRVKTARVLRKAMDRWAVAMNSKWDAFRDLKTAEREA